MNVHFLDCKIGNRSLYENKKQHFPALDSDTRNSKANYCLSATCHLFIALYRPWDHLRCFGVNVSSSFAIIDGDVGPHNIFAIDPYCSLNNHVVQNKASQRYWITRELFLQFSLLILLRQDDVWEKNVSNCSFFSHGQRLFRAPSPNSPLPEILKVKPQL